MDSLIINCNSAKVCSHGEVMIDYQKNRQKWIEGETDDGLSYDRDTLERSLLNSIAEAGTISKESNFEFFCVCVCL